MAEQNFLGVFRQHAVLGLDLFSDLFTDANLDAHRECSALHAQRTNEIFPATIKNRQPNTLTFRNNINARTNR